jgi:hypothetical protein
MVFCWLVLWWVVGLLTVPFAKFQQFSHRFQRWHHAIFSRFLPGSRRGTESLQQPHHGPLSSSSSEQSLQACALIMWLIDTESLKLEFVDNPEDREYAILSHTWGSGEVSFQEMANLDLARTKPGFSKIERT